MSFPLPLIPLPFVSFPSSFQTYFLPLPSASPTLPSFPPLPPYLLYLPPLTSHPMPSLLPFFSTFLTSIHTPAPPPPIVPSSKMMLLPLFPSFPLLSFPSIYTQPLFLSLQYPSSAASLPSLHTSFTLLTSSPLKMFSSPYSIFPPFPSFPLLSPSPSFIPYISFLSH